MSSGVGPSIELDDDAADAQVDGTVDRQSVENPASAAPPWWLWPLQAALLTGALYFLLRPENYGITPNGLDPFFYSGYAINFDDLLHGVGDRWYFVSRWSVYLPNQLGYKLAGPFLGRLLLRWLLATAIVSVLWRLGRRWNWTTAQRLLLGTVVVTMPMFVRPLFTDYTEYLVVALGVPLVCICLRRRQTALSTAVIGVISGLLLVSNPVTITAIALPLAAATLFGAVTWRGRAAIGTGIVLIAGSTLVAGLLLFRWRYGIDNVYQPTVDYIRSAPGADPLKSPRLEWLGRFTWIYGPPLLLAVALGTAKMRHQRLDRTEAVALGMCGVQYVLQWFDQFVRDGSGLEISYYWCYAYPTFVVALAIVIGRLTRGVRREVVYGIGALWLMLLLVGVPSALRLPAGVWFAGLAVVVVGVIVLLSRRRPWLSAALLLALLGWTQLGAPPYDPSAYHPYNMSPRYDALYRRAGDESETLYHEAVWFEEQMDRVPSDEFSAFVPLGAWTNSIVGVYAPHVVGRILAPELSPSQMMSRALQNRPAGAPLIVAVYGPPDEVDARAALLRQSLNLGAPVLDVVHSSAMKYRLVVFERPDETYLPFTWTADLLQLGYGTLSDTTVTGTPADQPGPLTGGPLTWLVAGDYQVTLTYSSPDDATKSVGELAVTSPEKGAGPALELFGTNGEPTEVVVDFSVPGAGGRWSFDTSRADGATLTIASVTLAKSP